MGKRICPFFWGGWLAGGGLVGLGLWKEKNKKNLELKDVFHKSRCPFFSDR